MSRQVFKLYEVMRLLATGKEANLEVCSLDLNRPEKSGLLLKLKNVTLVSNTGLTKGKVRLANGEVQAIHPCLIEKYNGVKVTP